MISVRAPRRAIALAGALAALGAAGCVRAPYAPLPCQKTARPDLTGCVVEDLDFEGAKAVSAGDVEEHLATSASTHPLGGALAHVPVLGVIDRLAIDYAHFDRFVLERDLERVERYYRARGYYQARVHAGRATRLPDGQVHVEIVVEEGPPVKIGAVDLAWKDWSPTIGGERRAASVTKAVTNAKNELALGAPFAEDAFEATKKTILRAMTDRGFAYASVEGHVDVDLAAHAARVVYTLELGPHCTFGDVRFEGLVGLPGSEGPLRRSLGFEKGDEFSTAALDSAQYALSDFGVFSVVELVPQLSSAGQPRVAEVPILVRTQPGKLRTLKIGIGAEAGWQVEGHGVAGWDHRNFLGGLRHFLVEAKGGPVFYPTRLDTLLSQPPTRVLPQLKLRTELSQPLPFRLTSHLAASFNLYRLQPTTGSVDATTPIYTFDPAGPTMTKLEPNIIGYREYTGRMGIDRTFTRWRHYVGLFYNLQLFSPFSYNEPTAPVGYSNVLVPYAQLTGTLDFRRGVSGAPDRIHPHSGFYFSADAQLASGTPTNANDFRIRPEVRAYVGISKRVTLATRLAVGFLFPQNYGGRLSGATASSPDECHDLQLLQLRGLFSGGPYSNRGYGYNDVGPHVTATCSAQVSTVNENTPTGGLSMWEASTELRLPIGESLGTAFFVDASDVTPCEGYLRLTHPHLSAGLGLRYDTPVGPLRADVGYRIPGAQAFNAKLGCARDMPDFEPPPVLGLPIAVSIAIGEAF
jgi:outer membrane protein insertion porin family/translocation and assembly module TamA